MRLDDKAKELIEAILAKDHRVEIVPTKDGVRIYRLRREEVRIESKKKTY